jgi:hypothetical protein
MKRAYYSDTIKNFLSTVPDDILGKLTRNSEFDVMQSQRDAWLEEIEILRRELTGFEGSIYFEFSIPRMGRRIDALIIIGSAIFVVEFKIGDKEFTSYALDQVCDYALDLKNFHETSHECFIAPILVATQAHEVASVVAMTPQNDNLLFPIKCNDQTLGELINNVLAFCGGSEIDSNKWEGGRYNPTPTIIEAARTLYNRHSVADISRNDASATNLTMTSGAISRIIRESKANSHKSICFVTGVPGAGKTLVGLNVATENIDKANELYSVFLSGNGPLVAILHEALARDRVQFEKEQGRKIKKGEALRQVKAFIQNIHHFRDECLTDPNPPPEHVVLFDEAQRAWNMAKTTDFMHRRKGRPNFNISEPEFLISCLDRHSDWAVIVCLVGGGQEIHTGEAGISEWVESLIRSYPDWHIHISPKLMDSEYNAKSVLKSISSRPNVSYEEALHLFVSMRSFRSENVSLLVKQLLDQDVDEARQTLSTVRQNYPIVVTRNVGTAKRWLKEQARGTERYGIVVSSQALRLKPYAIDVKSPMDPIHWFLDGKEDVRSSYYLEDVATEFQVQGLELDWACVTWDADFRYRSGGWEHWSFQGKKWNRIIKDERQLYLKNAYRVLLTRARQGMVIVVPPGDSEDHTRKKSFYDPTFSYLQDLGFEVI